MKKIMHKISLFPTVSAFFAMLLLIILLMSSVQTGWAAHGISIDGKLKYPDDFKRFGYVSDKARKGGTLVLHDLGSFDKMNPYTLKGAAPAGLDNLVFETLAVSSLDEPFAAYGLIAKDIELAADRLSVTYTLDPAARFSDGSPVTPEDVEFSVYDVEEEELIPVYLDKRRCEQYRQQHPADIGSVTGIRSLGFFRVNVVSFPFCVNSGYAVSEGLAVSVLHKI